MSQIKVQDLDSQTVQLYACYLKGQFCADLSNQEMQAVENDTIFVRGKYPGDRNKSVTTKYLLNSDDYVNSLN